MFHVCWRCGAFHAEKTVDPDGMAAICPACGYRHPFRQLPLMLVGGASGAGKSTVCQLLLGALPEVVLLDSDTLWQPAFDTPADGFRAFFTTWLRLCVDIGQAGRPVVLFGAGVGVPSNLEPCAQRRYFSRLHYLALTCDDETLLERLRRRPAWRGADAPFQEGQVAFNRWYRDIAPHTDPPVATLDTTQRDPAETAAAVAAWVRAIAAGG